MSIYTILFKVLISLILTAVNITEFFLLVRTVMLFKEVAWLKPFDTAGKDLTASYTTRIDSLFYRIKSKHLSERGRMIIGLVVLELIKAFLGGAGYFTIYID
ncbi:MAG: hypothetical protein KAS23_00800 [Anaerohalosphaera sp.]|nr:hypothetical protein [Anaerohalosphaera sp.]